MGTPLTRKADVCVRKELLQTLLKRTHVQRAVLWSAGRAVDPPQVLRGGRHDARVVESDVAEVGRRGGGRCVVPVVETLGN